MEYDIKNKNFDDLNAGEIEGVLLADLYKNKERTKRNIIILIIALAFIFRGAIMYWVKFGIAIPSGYTNEIIDTSKDPVQINYSPKVQKEKTFTYHSLINNNEMEIIPQAHYVLSGKVIASNHDFVFISKFFDSAALYDLGTAWGKMADKSLYKKYIKVYSQKVEITGSRRLNWRWRNDIPFSPDYITSHLSHTHIIPATRNVMAAMLLLRLYNDFKLEGELVDMNYYDKKYNQMMKYYTSMSRYDSDESSRGSGACETMYVTKVQIGKTIYK